MWTTCGNSFFWFRHFGGEPDNDEEKLDSDDREWYEQLGMEKNTLDFMLGGWKVMKSILFYLADLYL